MKYNISKQQIDILIMAAVILIVTSVFYVFVYTPRQKQLGNLKQELERVENTLGDIEKLVGSRKDLGKGILRLREEASSWDLKFIKPDETAELLKILSEEARRLNIEVASIQPAELKPLLNKGSILKLDDAECNRISIDINLAGTYLALVDYMQKIEHRKAPQMVIKKVDIEKYQGSSRLNAHMVVEGVVLLQKTK